MWSDEAVGLLLRACGNAFVVGVVIKSRSVSRRMSGRCRRSVAIGSQAVCVFSNAGFEAVTIQWMVCATTSTLTPHKTRNRQLSHTLRCPPLCKSSFNAKCVWVGCAGDDNGVCYSSHVAALIEDVDIGANLTAFDLDLTIMRSSSIVMEVVDRNGMYDVFVASPSLVTSSPGLRRFI